MSEGKKMNSINWNNVYKQINALTIDEKKVRVYGHITKYTFTSHRNISSQLLDNYDNKSMTEIMKEIIDIELLKNLPVKLKRQKELILMLETQEKIKEIQEIVNSASVSGKIKGAIDLILLNDRVDKKGSIEDMFYYKKDSLKINKKGFDVKLFNFEGMTKSEKEAFMNQFIFSWENKVYDKDTWLHFAENQPKKALENKVYFIKEPYSNEILLTISTSTIDKGIKKTTDELRELNNKANNKFNELFKHN